MGLDCVHCGKGLLQGRCFSCNPFGSLQDDGDAYVEHLETRLSKIEEDIRPIIEADYTGQGSAQDYDALLEMIQEELAEALAGESNE